LYCALLLDLHLCTHVYILDFVEGDTTENVRKIISDIDPSYEITNIICSHRVGKPDEKAAAVVKHRQIIVRLSDPGEIVYFTTLFNKNKP
jgi:hypothetical protein